MDSTAPSGSRRRWFGSRDVGNEEVAGDERE